MERTIVRPRFTITRYILSAVVPRSNARYVQASNSLTWPEPRVQQWRFATRICYNQLIPANSRDNRQRCRTRNLEKKLRVQRFS